MVEALANESDLRAHPRRHVELDVTLESDSQFYTGFGEDVSEGGLFVATHVLRPFGTLLDVAFTLPTSNRRIRCEGEVRWVRLFSDISGVSPGMGIRFVRMVHEDVLAVRAFCIQRAPLFFTE